MDPNTVREEQTVVREGSNGLWLRQLVLTGPRVETPDVGAYMDLKLRREI